LLIVAIFLLIANNRARRVNRELTDIKATLEDRVARRTASLIETTEILKSREQYITNIVESMPLMLIGLNQKMEIIQWNRVAETATGRPIATVLGKNLWEAYPAITLTPAQVTEVIRSKTTMAIKHSQRDQYYFDMTLYPLTAKDETGVIILVDDITKQMKAENKVSERDKMSAMGELASAMAYDINLPLQYYPAY
jgi:PAS domain S-box-containing protein